MEKRPTITPKLIEEVISRCTGINPEGEGLPCRGCPINEDPDNEDPENDCTEIICMATYESKVRESKPGFTLRKEELVRLMIEEAKKDLLDPLYLDLLKVKEAADGNTEP